MDAPRVEINPDTQTSPGPAPKSRVEKLLPFIFVILCAASLIPIWTVRHHPLGDLGANLDAAAIWHFHDDPHYEFARYYDLSIGLGPNWAWYLAIRLFTFPFGLDTANRIVLSLYALGLPIGSSLLARRFGGSPYLGLFAFSLVWNFNFQIGFTSFFFGLAAVPFALCAFDAYCEKPTLPRALAATLCGASMFFFHLLPWGMYFAAAGMIGLFHRYGHPREFLGRTLVWAASPATGIAVILHGRGMSMGHFDRGLSGKFYPIAQSLTECVKWIWSGCVHHEDHVLIAVLFLGWLSLKLSAERRPLTLHGSRAEACFLVAAVAYLVLPRSLLKPEYWWGVNVRFTTFAALFAALSIGPIRGRRAWLLVPVAAAGLGFTIDANYHWRRANRFMYGFEQLESIPSRDSRVLVLAYPPLHDTDWTFNYAQIYAPFYQAERGGFQPWNFDVGFPMKYRVRYPAPSWLANDFQWDKHARYYDYVLTFQQGNNQPFGGHANEVIKIKQSGNWILWKLPGPRVDVPPAPAYLKS